MIEQLAQVPEVAITKTADRLLDYGVLGAFSVVLLVAVFLLARALISRTDASIQAAADSASANATVIANNTAAFTDVKDELRELRTQISQLLWRQNVPPIPPAS